MKKASFIIPHFKTWKWTAICLWNLKTYGIPVEQEIIIVDNSPGHPSIRAIEDTELGEGVKIVSGDAEFTSHGMAYDIGFKHSDGDRIFTCESDSFPFRHGWFDEYVKLSSDFDLIGPEIPQSAGRYIHPAGALYSRKVIESAIEWQRGHEGWIFCPSSAIELGTSDRAYHVVADEEFLQDKQWDSPQIDIWRRAGPWQEMRCFDDDTFDNYSHRTGIVNLEPVGRPWHNKIGFEAGQWLAYFADKKGFRSHRADLHLEWMPGHEGKQAAYSDVMGGFRHCWAGSVSTIESDLPDDVRQYKIGQREQYWFTLPPLLRRSIEAMEESNR